MECLRYLHEAGAPWPNKLYETRCASVLVQERRRHYAAGILGRAWRRHAVIRNMKRKRAVGVIEAAVLDWMMRPPRPPTTALHGEGRCGGPIYDRVRSDWDAQVRTM